MGRRKKRNVRPFESAGEKFTDQTTGTVRADTSANIYESMLLSSAFQDLKPRQQMLYIVCKSQFYGHRKPSQDFPEMEAVQADTCFYLNLAAVCRYGLYSRNMRGKFYQDMKVLQEHGFIKLVSSGASTKTKSIYRFSSDWQRWRPTQES